MPLPNLTGLKTDDGWTVGESVVRHESQTGGNFSEGYAVRHQNGRLGYLKALDFTRIASGPGSSRKLEEAIRTYNYEKDVLDLCRGASMSKVAVAIGSGYLPVPGAPLDTVYYLIFEMADGDVRKHVALSSEFDLAWTLRALHNVAVGLSQLHSKQVFHQDLKPSNLLVFDGGDTSKIADLGRSSCKDLAAPHDDLICAGVTYYAPPEQLYRHSPDQREFGRAAADLYLLGSVLYFFFRGQMFTPDLVNRLRPDHRPRCLASDDGGWTGPFDDVLPYLYETSERLIADFDTEIRLRLPHAGFAAERQEIGNLLRWLVDPNPQRRGHPQERQNRHHNQLALRRFVSALDRISLRCARRLLKANAEKA